jgi:protein kinase-like protein
VATLTDANVPRLQDICSRDGIADLVAQLADERVPRAALARARAAGYRSPEQVRHESLDSRSDVFLLGCLLYERLSGAPPFEGGTRAARDHAVLFADPRDLADPPYRMPSGIARIVARCLEKHPDRRYQSPRELAYALRAIELEPARRGARLMAMAAGALLIAALVLLSSRMDLGRWPWNPAPVQGVAVVPIVNR